MRVVMLVADPGIPLAGMKGASRHVREVRAALSRRGHDVYVVAAAVGAAGESERVIPIPADVAHGSERSRAAQSWVADHSAEIARRIGGADLLLERLALYPCAGSGLASDLGAAHLLEVNAPLAEESARYRGLADFGAAEAAERKAIGAADGIVAVSRALRDRAIALRGSVRGVLHLPNGVDVAAFAAGSGARAARRAELRVGDTTCVVAFVGTLKAWHGVEHLLAACEASIGRHVDLHLLIVGDGPGAASLRQRAATGVLAARVTFTGAVAPDQVPEWLAAADVGAAFYPALPGFYFSPLKVAEYAAAGLAIARSRHPDIDDLVPDGATSLSADPHDLAGFSALLDRLAVDAGLRASLGNAARNHALRALDWGVKVDHIVELARSLPRHRAAASGA